MRNRDPAYSLHAENYTVPLPNASVGCPTVALPLVRASIATHETDPRLSDSATSREGPEIGYANQQESSAYVRCPTDHQNWHVILPKQGGSNMGPRGYRLAGSSRESHFVSAPPTGLMSKCQRCPRSEERRVGKERRS